MRFRWLGILIAAGLLATAAPARAWDLAVGVKWLPVNYTTPVSSTQAGLAGGITPLTGWNTTSINNYVGGFILDGRLGFTLGMDLGYSSRSISNGTGPSTDFSFTQFGFSLGSKYYLLKPRASRVAPYVLFDFYKYFASVSTNAMPPKGTEDVLGGLASPLGIDAAVGVEYFFTNSFSLGAELLGLKYAYSAGSATIAAVGFGPSSTATTTNQYVTFYTGITLNYRFEIAGVMHVKDSDEAPASAEPPPKTHRREIAPEKPQSEPPPPPPREAPPAEPESVD